MVTTWCQHPATLEPNGYQDIHILLSGLNPQRAIKTIEIRPEGGGFWSSDQSSGYWKIAVERSPGSRTADLYFETDHAEKGRSYQINLVYQDGMAAESDGQGGPIESEPSHARNDADDPMGRAGRTRLHGVGDSASGRTDFRTRV